MTIDEYQNLLAAQTKARAKNPIKQRIGANSRAMGSCFEELIEKSCLWYQEQGQAYIEKTPEPMKVIQPAELNGNSLHAIQSQRNRTTRELA